MPACASGLCWPCSASPSSTSPGCTSHRRLGQLRGLSLTLSGLSPCSLEFNSTQPNTTTIHFQVRCINQFPTSSKTCFESSSCFRSRTIVIWLIFLIPSEMEVPGWHDGFSGWSLAGYVVSINGVFLFNNIVILPTIRKYRNKNSWVVEYSIELFISFSHQSYHDDICQRDWMSHSIVWEKRNLPFVYNDNNETMMLFVICIVHPPCVPCNTFGEQWEI